MSGLKNIQVLRQHMETQLENTVYLITGRHFCFLSRLNKLRQMFKTSLAELQRLQNSGLITFSKNEIN